MLTVTPKYLDATTIVLSTIHSEQVDKPVQLYHFKAVDSHKTLIKAFKAATQPLKCHSSSHSKVSVPLDPLLGKLHQLLSDMRTPDSRGLLGLDRYRL